MGEAKGLFHALFKQILKLYYPKAYNTISTLLFDVESVVRNLLGPILLLKRRMVGVEGM